jgi:predicted DNA-binding ribbon-helix-helix protein
MNKHTFNPQTRTSSSISLEPQFYSALQEIAIEQRKSLAQIMRELRETGQGANLSSSLRIFIYLYYRKRLDAVEKRAEQMEELVRAAVESKKVVETVYGDD